MSILDWFRSGKSSGRIRNDASVGEQRLEVEGAIPTGVMGGFTMDTMQRILGGADCDEISNGKGSFGYVPTNPIPVNGPLGEIKYLARLSCPCGTGIMFHRLGSMKHEGIDMDVYETVCLAGKHWSILYFDFYHPRRSRKLPAGFSALPYNKLMANLAFGTNRKVLDFPKNLPPYVAEQSGISALGNRCKELIESGFFSRPPDHWQACIGVEKSIGKIDALSQLLAKAWEAMQKGMTAEALKNYSEAFDVLTREAVNHAHATDGTVSDTKETRMLLPKYFTVVKEYYRRNGTACTISHNMGILFAAAGDTDSARGMFEQSIELTPERMNFPDPQQALERLEG